MSTLTSKLSISLFSATLFAIVNLPQTYQFTDKLIGAELYNSATNCPTYLGILLHTVVFFGLSFLSMLGSDLSLGIKLKHSLYGTLIYFLLSSPTVYSFVGSLFGDSKGCPTTTSVLIHAGIFTLFLVAVMYLPSE